MKMRVLLVDDEQQFVDILAQRLEARGLMVATAYNGDEALARLKESEADVILLDVLMPGRSGIDILREIKQARPLTEVILLTGHATVETAIEGMKLGAYDYLMKPMETEVLVEKIRKAFRRKADQEKRIRQAEVDRIVKSRAW
jgi:two-component system, OmpR family, response regulator CpxR